MDGDARPSRVLVAMFQGGGNIPLLLPILKRLPQLGHRVRVIVGPGVRPSRLPVSDALRRSLHESDAAVIPLSVPDVHPLERRAVSGVVAGWIPAAFQGVAAEAAVATWIPQWAEQVARELEREPADLVVTDFVLAGALVAAEWAEVPSVALVHTVYPRTLRGRPPYGPGWMPRADILGRVRDTIGRSVAQRIYDRDALPFLNAARAALSLPPVSAYFDQHERAARVLVLVSPHFDFPADLPANVRLVGTPHENHQASWSPPWPADDARPMVLLSLSTLAQGQAPVMERILSALATLPVRALVTLGPSLADGSFTPPPNVVLEPFVHHDAVLPRVAAVVTQCGLGTVTKALAHGVPVVCLPLVGDQADNAARVVALGAGIRLRPDTTVSRIAEAIASVIADRRWRLAAQRFAEATAEEHPVQRAVEEIQTILRRVGGDAHEPATALRCDDVRFPSAHGGVARRSL